METDKTDKTHLYRGAPAVRAWSHYQHTVAGWTLCGIKRRGKPSPSEPSATEDASLANCRYCRMLTAHKTPAKAK